MEYWYCTIRTRDDVDWVVDRVLLGDWVTLRVGGLQLPRTDGLRAYDALCLLEDRLTEAGAELRAGCSETAQRRMVRGRSALAVPGPEDGGDEAGVREPRRTPPSSPSMARTRR